MHRAALFLLLAFFAGIAAFGVPSLTLIRPLAAQTAEMGPGVRVEGSPSTRVNVRREPEVRDGNVVAQARGGAVLRTLESRQVAGYRWYRVETLPDVLPAFSGWIRGDLLAPEALPFAAAPSLPPPSPSEPPADAEPTAIPLDQRTDWARNLLSLMPAIQGCTRVSSAPPAVVHHAVRGSRGLAEILISDAAGRHWHCLINDYGGTPLRYDPLSGGAFLRERMTRGPFFVTGAAEPAVDPACHGIEKIEDPNTRAHLGWLYYRTC